LQFLYIYIDYLFSALTLLIGWREGHLVCKMPGVGGLWVLMIWL